MQTQTKDLGTTNSSKPLQGAVKHEAIPLHRPEIAKLEQMTPYLAEIVTRRNPIYYGRGIPYSPLND